MPYFPPPPLLVNSFVLNGGMEVSQRNGASLVTLASGVESYIVDGWTAKFNRAATLGMQAGQVSAGTIGFALPSGFQSALMLQCTTGLSSLATGDYAYVSCPIEGYQVSRLDLGKSTATFVTFDFWVAGGPGGTGTVTLQNAAGNRSYPSNFAFAGSTTWTKVTVTVLCDTTGTWLATNGIGLRAIFCFGSGATNQGTASQWNADGKFATSSTTNSFGANGNFVVLTGVGGFAGTQAPSAAQSPLFVPPFEKQLPDCLRFYEKSYDYATAIGAVTRVGVVGLYIEGETKSGVSLGIRYRAPKRATPTSVTPYSGATGTSGMARDFTAGADVAVTADLIGENSARLLYVTGVAGQVSLEAHYVVEAGL